MSKFSLDVLRLPNYRRLLLTRLFGTMGLQCQAVIVGWQIYSLTKDPFMLGLTGLTEAVPAILCALFAGHIVDISKPHRIYFFCYLALSLNTLMLFLFAGGIVTAAHSHLLFLIYACIFTSGMARSFIMPASYALLPQIVPRPLIPSAMAWQTSCFQIGAIAGPAIAGLVYGIYGSTIAWLLPVSMMMISFVLLNFIDTSQNEYKREKREPALQSILNGWRFILKNQVLLSVMALDMFAVLFGGAVSMLPAYADQVLHVGSEGLGALRAAPAIGAVITSILLATRPMKVLSAKRLLIVVAGFGVCIICFGLSHIFGLSMLFLALSGAFDSVSMVIRSTLMQLLTPDDMRGRVSSVNSMFIISSNEIGSFESGTAASLLGLIPSVVLGGMATLGIVGLTAWLSPKLRGTVVRTDEAN
jgi:MFS family permease